MTTDDPLLRLLARFRDEQVEYVLVGGQAVRLNDWVLRSAEADRLRPASRKQIKAAVSGLHTASSVDSSCTP